MSAQNVPLTEHGQEFVDAVAKSGEHSTVVEVVDTALRQMEQKKRANEAKVEAFREAARVGFDDLDNGRYTEVAREDLPEFVAGLSPRLQRADTAE